MSTVTIGNFDGVHIGHQALLNAARMGAGNSGVIAYFFDEHPATIARGAGPASLTTVQERRRLLYAAGATSVEVLHASKELLAKSPEEFMHELHLRAPFDTIVEGRDFRFGHKRSGDAEALERMGKSIGFRTIIVDDVDVALSDGHRVGARSSIVRWLVGLGRVADAARVLGRPYRVCGLVVAGARRGREIGFPTANIDAQGVLWPADGVYGVRLCVADGREWRGAASIGKNPVFGGSERVLEVHALNAAQGLDLYGQSVAVDFLSWIRETMNFDSVDRLVTQIQRDCDRVPA